LAADSFFSAPFLTQEIPQKNRLQLAKF